jgi:hypothetical protein
MRGKNLRKLCAAVGVVGLVVAATATGASAHRAPVVSAPIVDGLAGPLQFEVGHDGKVLVGQSFSGTVSTVDRNGTVTDLFNDPGVDGVSKGAFGTVIYTHTDGETGVVELRLHTPWGPKTIASTIDHETRKNPDAHQSYGLQGLSPECAAQIPADAPGLVPYTGIVESHPYAVTPAFFGWYIADAAANDILFVDWFGRVRTVAVLPAQPPVVVTAEAVAASEVPLPTCIIGLTLITEPVPTDVERGNDGSLYVSTLPGGPEDPSLGARGSVYKVNPWSGRSWRIATGFAGATNLAVSPWGGIYVSELFGGQVSKVVNGGPSPVAAVPSPSGLEWSGNKLYVGTDTFGSGKIQTISF